MSEFTFVPEPSFPRWWGPFSPARGTYSGFRLRGGRLGTWVADEAERSFWPVRHSQGADSIADLVSTKWGGGRVLLLPNGFVVKPLRDVDDVGKRVLIGRYSGDVVLESGGRRLFNMSKAGVSKPGDRWPGPATTGLECIIHQDGSLTCRWYHPTDYGSREETDTLVNPNQRLAAGFRAARRADSGGRVRITANGHVITNRQEGDTWKACWIGKVNTSYLTGWEQWIERRSR